MNIDRLAPAGDSGGGKTVSLKKTGRRISTVRSAMLVASCEATSMDQEV